MITDAYAFGQDIHIVTDADMLTLSAAVHRIGYNTDTLRFTEPTIEDCFINLNRKPL